MEIEIKSARQYLTYLWVTISSIIFLVFVLQTINGKYENKVEEAWGWLLSNILPNLTIVVTAFCADSKRSRRRVVILKKYFLFSLSCSLAYLLILCLIVFYSPFSLDSTIDYYKNCLLFLSPLQLLVGISLGILFTKGTL